MIIILILIALILIIFNYKAIKKERNSFKDILRLNEESSEDYMLEIINLRKDFGETITELQKEILDLKKQKEIIITNSVTPISNEDDRHINIDNHKDIFINNDSNNNEMKSKVEEKITNEKVSKVKALLNQGFNMEEICAQLNLGKGEVLLIKELYLK